MTQFTTRLELHNTSSEDYETLHEAMSNEGFSRQITSDEGVTYHLPTAEYDFRGSENRSSVLDKAKRAAASTGRSHGILVTELAGRTWMGLKTK